MKKVTKEASERCAKHTLQEQLEAHRAELALMCKVETAIAAKRIRKYYEDLAEGAEHGQDQGEI